ncbi:hypothetical protein FACS189494_03100 [Spirochaetia bacterium]|nr:hypothetical protein FACS189494_03100 [Spirochaetia bacterium]
MKKRLLALMLAPVLFTACIGVQADITLNKNGSGTLNLTYTVSKKFAAMGTTDGNASKPAFAVGEEDFLRTVNSIDGFKLKKHKVKDTKENRIYIINVAFSDINALLKFLDESGAKASLLHENNKSILRITLVGGDNKNGPVNGLNNEAINDSGLTKTAAGILSPYEFGFSVNVRGAAASFKLLDGEGRGTAKPALGEVKIAGSKISYTAGMDQIAASDKTVIMEVSW